MFTSPVAPFLILAGFLAPADPFAPGHRGLDLRAQPGQAVVAPAAGVVTFAGRVGGKDVVTLRVGALLVSLEPVAANVTVGALTLPGTPLGVVTSGSSHCADRCLHIGIRLEGRYADPRRWFGRIRLLP